MKWAEIEADTLAREAELLRWLEPYGFVPCDDVWVSAKGAVAAVIATNLGMGKWLEHITNGKIQARDLASVWWKGPTIKIMRRMGFDNADQEGNELPNWYKQTVPFIFENRDILDFDYGITLASDEDDDSGDQGVEHLHTYVQSISIWKTDPDRAYHELAQAVKFNDVVGDYMQSKIKAIDDDLDILDI